MVSQNAIHTGEFTADHNAPVVLGDEGMHEIVRSRAWIKGHIGGAVDVKSRDIRAISPAHRVKSTTDQHFADIDAVGDNADRSHRRV